ncbi:MAG TPA: sulfite exporter TauE/SafE family protein [Fimbriimonadaceae bacterium]|nr:sulfite exporter TauE/SafE family protein [Fimbriimonadaceae bacterium]
MLAAPTDGLSLALLVLAGIVASAINAVAGGGSLVSFPTLVGLGVPPLIANATNAVALWPGSLASAIGFWSKLATVKDDLVRLLLVTLIGSAGGAWLLISTPQSVFRAVIPGLLLVATLLLAYQPRIKTWSQGRTHRAAPWIAALLQFLVAIYGGYFGAGMGILMLAVFGLYLAGDIHEHNAIKSWLAVVINATATLVFLFAGVVLLVPALALMVGALVGGYLGAVWSQKVEAELLRKAIVVLGFVLTAWFTYQVVAG